MNAPRESRLATMMIVGGIMIVGGVFATASLVLGSMFTIVSVAGILSVVAGIAVIGVSVFSGISHNSKADKGASRVDPGYVMARFAVNQGGEMIFSNFDEDAIDGRYYVRLRFKDGHDEELECAPEVFGQAGEGMWGYAAIRGRWLGGFTPIPKPADQPPLARP